MPTFNKARGCFTIFVDIEDGSPDSDIPVLYNYDEALKLAESLDRKYRHKRAVYLSELGSFRSNNKERREFLEIWWNTAWEDDREPKKRGYGFYVPEVGRKRWVEYDPYLADGPPDEDFDIPPVLTDRSGEFSVKHQGDDAEPVWINLTDYDAALAKAKELALDSTCSVSIYEWARFRVDRQQKNDLVEFWWSENRNEMNCAAPKGRGIGLVYRGDGSPVFVSYEPSSPSGNDETDTLQDDDSGDDDSDDYVKTHCEDCGKIMPLYEKFEYEYEEEVGRSSGAARFGSSSRRRHSTGGRSSYSSGSSTSYSTGRTYYATRKLILCEDCCDARIAADKEAKKWTLFDWVVVIAVVVVAIGAGLFLLSILLHP